ncbi:hypothetical protein AVEN_34500-1 [Araneus ventricosus]|uniref:Uncharacterized protein n=1 Tax=Araneus ventricosus TaxID=182803 RepID=A0A4Y2MTP6_ARAVE|nr:hypothetical protein AVEN_34500-1 [Araneus ventricosus]
MQLFTRIAALFQSNENLRDRLKDELSPLLLDKVSLKKNAKSTLAAIIESFQQSVKSPSTYLYVINEGFLLYALAWGERDTYRNICLKYVRFQQKRFSPCDTVVF